MKGDGNSRGGPCEGVKGVVFRSQKDLGPLSSR